MLVVHGDNIGDIWFDLVNRLVTGGQKSAPRGKPILERVGVSIELHDILNCLVYDDIRKPSPRFAVAEWLWIWFGREDVASIAQYSKQIAQFSDDGKTFAGAYGPPFAQQWPIAVDLLTKDPDSRQAVIDIFQRPRENTKDVPCTLTMQYLIRQGKLETIVNMRSSDVWVGLIYDVFNFSMLANITAAVLGVEPGSLIMNLGSSHLYETNLQVAKQVLDAGDTSCVTMPELVDIPPMFMNEILETRRWPFNEMITQKVDMKTWLTFARVLLAPNNEEAWQFLNSEIV